MIRVVALVAPTLTKTKQEVFRHLLNDCSIELVGVCIDVHRGESAISKIRRELRRGRGGYVAIQIIKGLLAKCRQDGVSSATFFEGERVCCMRCEDLYSEETLERIRNWQPDVLFRSGFGMIREPILSIAPYGVLSYHHGNIRKYRGQPPAFWELHNGEKEMGVTIQRLAMGLDCGMIIKEMTVPIRLDDTWRKLRGRAYGMTGNLALEAIKSYVGNGVEGTVLAKDELGKIYTTPNLREWLRLQVRVIGRVLGFRLRRMCRHKH